MYHMLNDMDVSKLIGFYCYSKGQSCKFAKPLGIKMTISQIRGVKVINMSKLIWRVEMSLFETVRSKWNYEGRTHRSS